MRGIAGDTVHSFRSRVENFRPVYIEHWNAWLAADALARPAHFGRILRRWQACRPNRMRREAGSKLHAAPYLDDLLATARPHLDAVATFDIATPAAIDSPVHVNALHNLWDVFEMLSYHGRTRHGLAGAVGISKAVMLATNGRVGPAFDSSVRSGLRLGEIRNPVQWLVALRTVNEDIQAFERRTGVAFATARPTRFAGLENGRVYDMALGPR